MPSVRGDGGSSGGSWRRLLAAGGGSSRCATLPAGTGRLGGRRARPTPREALSFEPSANEGGRVRHVGAHGDDSAIAPPTNRRAAWHPEKPACWALGADRRTARVCANNTPSWGASCGAPSGRETAMPAWERFSLFSSLHTYRHESRNCLSVSCGFDGSLQWRRVGSSEAAEWGDGAVDQALKA